MPPTGAARAMMGSGVPYGIRTRAANVKDGTKAIGDLKTELENRR
jgi:hypothetical protein